MHINIQENSMIHKEDEFKYTQTKTYYGQTVQKQKQSFENSQREITYHMQVILNKNNRFSAETLASRSKWADIFKVLNENFS